MAQQQQYPPAGGRGGRGGGRGGQPHQHPHQHQQTPSYYPAAAAAGGRAGGAPMGAWQPAPQPYGATPQQQQQRAAAMPYQVPYYNPYAAHAHGAYRYPNHPAQQQQQQQQQQYPNMHHGVFYPGQLQQQQAATSAAAAVAASNTTAAAAAASSTVLAAAPPTQPAAREKKPLTITDKKGNVLSITPAAKPAPAKSATTPRPVTPPAITPGDAGEKLRQAALRSIEESAAAAQPTESVKKAETAKAAPAKSVAAAAPAKVTTPAASAVEKTTPAASAVEKTAPAASAVEKIAPVPFVAEKKSSLAALMSKPPAPATAPVAVENGNGVYPKSVLLQFKDIPYCMQRPDSLPEMTIVRSESRQDKGRAVGGGVSGNRRGSHHREGGGGGGGGGENWMRGNAPPGRQTAKGNNNNSGGDQWSRGQAPPKQQQQNQRGGRRGGHNDPPLFDGPVAPLVKSENHWKPRQNTSALIVAEKQVKAILNKMTKEKFDRLASQMLEIPIVSYQTMCMMIENVYDKAIDEPTFGDMYGDLCARLSQTVKGSQFVYIIDSDEDPPTEDGETSPPSEDVTNSGYRYRWSNDVSTADAEVVGPLASEDECFAIAFAEEGQDPIERGDMELEVVKVAIRRGMFIKVMKKKSAEEGEHVFFTVFFPASEAEECGQQLSKIFTSEVECQANANKSNTFRFSLLNKCEEEFNKKDIYVDWKREKEEYDAEKSTLTEAQQAEKEEELDFRRIRIKKQMLGNVKFIGQLFKKRLLKEKVMRYCVSSLLKLEERQGVKAKTPEYDDTGDTDIDEEDHEAICSMFTTIGSTIDTLAARDFMNVCFSKISLLSQAKSLPSRSRFMYKDLLELRSNNWIPRRKEEKAKTIAEIRKDIEHEERQQAKQSSRGARGGGDYRGGRAGVGDFRGLQRNSISARSRQPKMSTQTDDDGFTTVSSGRAAGSAPVAPRSPAKPRDSMQGPGKTIDSSSFRSRSANSVDPLSPELLQKRIKSMRTEFLGDGGNLEELLLTWDEMSGTPGAGRALVEKNSDRIMECKEDERRAIYRIVCILCEKGKLTKGDVQLGLEGAIEFIDSTVMDAPKAFEYLGELIGDMLRIKMFGMDWLCAQCRKTRESDPDTHAPEKLIRSSLLAVARTAGAEMSSSLAKDAKVAVLLSAESLATIMDGISSY